MNAVFGTSPRSYRVPPDILHLVTHPMRQQGPMQSVTVLQPVIFAAVIVALLLVPATEAQLSAPVAHDDNFKTGENKFLQKDADMDKADV